MTAQQPTIGVTPTLFIGLGGIGKATLLFLRRQLHLRGLLDLPCFKWLYYDTDSDSTTNQDGLQNKRDYDLNESEKIIVEVNGDKLRRIVDNKGEYPHITSWCPDAYLTHPGLRRARDGAGQIRALGRLPLFDDDTHERIINHLGDVQTDFLQLAPANFQSRYGVRLKESTERQGQVTSKWDAIVICSAGGGTGSGSFLDFGYLLNPTIWENRTLYLVLPVGFMDDIPDQTQIIPNTYAALMELEYLNLVNDNTRVVPQVKYHTSSAAETYTWSNREPYNANFFFTQRNEHPLRLRDVAEIMADSLFMRFDAEGMGNAVSVLNSNFSNQGTLAEIRARQSRSISLPTEPGTEPVKLYQKSTGYLNFAVGLWRIVYPSFLIREFCVYSMLRNMMQCLTGEAAETADTDSLARTILQGLSVRELGLIADNTPAKIWASQAFADLHGEIREAIHGEIGELERDATASGTALSGRCMKLVETWKTRLSSQGEWRKQLKEAAVAFGQQVKNALPLLMSRLINENNLSLHAALAGLGTLSHTSEGTGVSGGWLVEVHHKAAARLQGLERDFKQGGALANPMTPDIDCLESALAALEKSRQEAMAHFNNIPARLNRGFMEAFFSVKMDSHGGRMAKSWRSRMESLAEAWLENGILAIIVPLLDPQNGVIGQALKDEIKRWKERKDDIEQRMRELDAHRQAIAEPPKFTRTVDEKLVNEPVRLYISALYSNNDEWETQKIESQAAYEARYAALLDGLRGADDTPEHKLGSFIATYGPRGRSEKGTFATRTNLMENLFGKGIDSEIYVLMKSFIEPEIKAFFATQTHDAIGELIELLKRKAPAESQVTDRRLTDHINKKLSETFVSLKNNSEPLLPLNNDVNNTVILGSGRVVQTNLLCRNRDGFPHTTKTSANTEIQIPVGIESIVNGVSRLSPRVMPLTTIQPDNISIYSIQRGYAIAQIRNIFSWYQRYMQTLRADSERTFYINKAMKVDPEILLQPTLHYPVLHMVDAARIIYKAIALGLLNAGYLDNKGTRGFVYANSISMESVHDGIQRFFRCVIMEKRQNNEITETEYEGYINERGFVVPLAPEITLWRELVRQVRIRENIIKNHFGHPQHSAGQLPPEGGVCILHQYRRLLAAIIKRLNDYETWYNDTANLMERDERILRSALLGRHGLGIDKTALEKDYLEYVQKRKIPEIDNLRRDLNKAAQLNKMLQDKYCETEAQVVDEEDRETEPLATFTSPVALEDLLRLNDDLLSQIRQEEENDRRRHRL